MLELSSKLLKVGYIWDYIGNYYRGIKWDTRSLDNGSCDGCHLRRLPMLVSPAWDQQATGTPTSSMMLAFRVRHASSTFALSHPQTPPDKL